MSTAPSTGPDEIIGRLLYRFADRDLVRSRQKHYLRYFQEISAQQVLDLGCGRGIFLELLREAGIKPSGVDTHLPSVTACRENGFDDVHHQEVLQFLQDQAAAHKQYDGIFCSHLIEHLSPRDAVTLLSLCNQVLKIGGRLMLVTPNPQNPEVMVKTFWLDPTHVRPYPRMFISSLLEETGFSVKYSKSDPRTHSKFLGREFYSIIPKLLLYGLGTFSGLDSIVVGERIR